LHTKKVLNGDCRALSEALAEKPNMARLLDKWNKAVMPSREFKWGKYSTIGTKKSD
jgi:hypothetical protein